MLAKIHSLRRRERQNSNPRLNSRSQDLNQACGDYLNGDNDYSAANTHETHKKQMILSTIADLKRNLESQSVELNGLNED